MRFFSLLPYGMIFKLYEYFPRFNSALRARSSAGKKIFQNFLHLKKLPEYCKTQSHHGNILSCFGAHNTPLNLNQQRKKSFRKIRKTHKNPFMFIKDHHRILQQYVAEHSANFNNVLKQERGIKNN